MFLKAAQEKMPENQTIGRIMDLVFKQHLKEKIKLADESKDPDTL